MPETHQKDNFTYVGNRVPWWLVLLYASFMVMTFSYLGTFFFRDLADWNADPHRMQTDLWQGRDPETQELVPARRRGNKRVVERTREGFWAEAR